MLLPPYSWFQECFPRSFAVSALVCGLVCTVAITSHAAQSGQLKVVTTIKPIHSLVSAIMQGVATPHLLVRGAGSPHAYRLRPSDARALNAADIVIRVSPEIESFITKAARNLPVSTQLVTLIDVAGLEVWPMRDGAKFEDHDGHDGHDYGHGHKNDNAFRDGHIWLAPDNAKVIVRYLVKTLSARAPEHTATFQANGARLLAEIDAVDKGIAERMEKIKKQRFIVFHDGFQYFERHFGLQAVGAVSLRSDVPPSGKRLLELRRNIKDFGVVCVFGEPQFRTRVIDTVIEGLSVHKGVLDSLGATLEPGPKLYPKLMQNLAAGFEDCLGSKP